LSTNSEKLSLFVHEHNTRSGDDIKNWGTFKDSLRAPVHRWFTYPAGFSFKAVEHSFERFNIKDRMLVYDPFMGSGTTNLTAKSKNICSVGVEAHPFVYEIAKAKMEWSISESSIRKFIDHINNTVNSKLSEILEDNLFTLTDYFPELILKCYPEGTLKKLLVIRNIFNEYKFKYKKEKSFFFVVITALLRGISSAATGWPYIAPKKAKITSESKDALIEFNKLALKMLNDLNEIKLHANKSYTKSNHNLILGSSTDVSNHISDESVDHVFTSPPYLNNFDYSDRTRLELYFWGFAKTWKDISSNVRAKLMTSATTQIVRSDPKYTILQEFKETAPRITQFIDNAATKLGKIRKTKGGKKSYDLMVIGYFNDIYKIMSEVYRVLKPKAKAIFVLGDSAPYGVHIPTDRLIGEIGCSVGFDSFSIEVLRKRGDKWKSNPQRHSIPLKESIVILKKNQ
jgi:DNA modification methylase